MSDNPFRRLRVKIGQHVLRPRREPLTPEEAVHLVERFEPVLKELAKAAVRAGGGAREEGGFAVSSLVLCFPCQARSARSA